MLYLTYVAVILRLQVIWAKSNDLLCTLTVPSYYTTMTILHK